MTSQPADEYRIRRDARAAARARLSRLDGRIAGWRLACVAAALAGGAAIVQGLLPVWILSAPAVAYAALAIWHDRTLRSLDCADRAALFYERGIARIEDRWHDAGEPGARFLSDDHLYARDLDIFGPGSLFQLLCRARTTMGEERLAGWLSAPAGAAEAGVRQAAVAQLRTALDFREALAASGRTPHDVDTASLAAWASAPPASEPAWLRGAAMALSAAIIGGGAWWIAGGPLAPLLFAVLAKMLLTRPSRARVARIVRGVERPLRQLDVLADMLALIEASAFESARLAELRSSMMSHGTAPSLAIRRLERLADMLDWRRNAFFAPISALLSWPLHLASAVEAWRAEYGPKVPTWLDAVAEYEALGSLAAYAYEHPGDPFPTIVDGPARFAGTGLGHPLVPAAKMVTNDVSLTAGAPLMIVSGSNMSGKSTLLRTVGVNVVLAMAGAPVRAQALTLTPLAVGATLQVGDSLQAGRSRFYTEISRIRRIADLTGHLPHPIFLLDELFQGTNSHDRRIGAEALLLSLIDGGAIGLTTTHDLALTAIAETSAGRAVNVHFEDRLEGGELVFDYRMKPGPVTHSNALALMQAVGLPLSTGVRATGRLPP